MIHFLARKLIRDYNNVSDAAVRRAYGVLCGAVGIVLNLLLFAGKALAGIISGSIAKDISRQYNVDPRKTASLLDIFSCVWQGIIPYGAQLLLVGSLSAGMISPVSVIPYLWYQQLLAVFAIVSVFIPFSEGICRKNPWNWEYDVAESGVAAKKAAMEVVK